MGRHRRQTGRQTRRLSASASRAILPATRRRGKPGAVPALNAAWGELEGQGGWRRASRPRLGSRLASGCGPPAGRPGLLSRAEPVVATISPRARGRQLGPQLGPGPLTSRAGREIAAVWAPRRCCRKPRQWLRRTPQAKGGYPEAVVVPTWCALPPAALAARDAGRALLAATGCQEQPGLGVVTRRQPRWEAPQMVWRVARLAPQRRLWSQRWLSRVPAMRWRWRGYGVVRLLQHVWTGSGRRRWRQGWMVSVPFDPRHPLAKPLQPGFAALVRGRIRGRCLR